MTDGEILDDIRLRLKAMSQSKLHGDKGIVQATMDAWGDSCADADKGWKRVRSLEAALQKIASLVLLDANRDVGASVTSNAVYEIAKTALMETVP